MKKKLVLALMFAVAMSAGAATTSFTSEAVGLTQAESSDDVVYGFTTAEDVELLKGIFDYEFYKEQNPELVEILGDDYNVLFEHFALCGIYEGRTCNPNFDPAAYASAYTDLKDVFGTNILEYYKHYITVGAAENRNLTTVEACAEQGITVTTLTENAIEITPQVYQFAKNHGINDYGAIQQAINHVASINGSSAAVAPSSGSGNTYVVVTVDSNIYEQARKLELVDTITITDEQTNVSKTLYIYRDATGIGVYNANTVDAQILYHTAGNMNATTAESTEYIGSIDASIRDSILDDGYMERKHGTFSGEGGSTPVDGAGHNPETEYHINNEYSKGGTVPNNPVDLYVGTNLENSNYTSGNWDYDSTNMVSYTHTIDGVYVDANNYRPLQDSDNVTGLDAVYGTNHFADERNTTPYDIGVEIHEDSKGVHVTVGLSNTETEFGLINTVDFVPNSNN